jgi:hypothetical protein
MAQSVTRRIERNLTASVAFQSRPTDKASIRGIHQGQRSCRTAQKGRTHDCKRPLLITKKLLQVGGHPHMRRRCSQLRTLRTITVVPSGNFFSHRSSLAASSTMGRSHRLHRTKVRVSAPAGQVSARFARIRPSLVRRLERRHVDPRVLQRLPHAAPDFDRTRRVAVDANRVGAHLDDLA